jgi:hypothetical protein
MADVKVKTKKSRMSITGNDINCAGKNLVI